MVNNFSEEHINIDNKDYTLFINRKGIVSFENITKFSSKASEIEQKYKEKDISIIASTENIEVTDKTNPFDYSSSEEIDRIEKDEEMLRDIYIKFYWIALYTNHKLSITEATELFEKAEKEYGLEQLVLLANQMIQDANKDKFNNTKIKKLEALNQTK